MKKLLILSFFLSLMVFSHEQDEGLFSTERVAPGVLILLDRSLSMDDPAYEYDTTEIITRVDVRLSGYSRFDHSTELEGWYDSEIFPDGPGEMSYFDDSPADDDWMLTVNGSGGNDTVLVSDWTLRFYQGGSYTDFSGSSFGFEIADDEVSDTITVSGIGTVDSVECYVNITTGAYMDSVWVGWWFWGHWEEELHQTEIGDVSVILEGPCIDIDISPTYLGTRIQSALLVLHALLDANGDGSVTVEDEEDLPIKIGQGCHRSYSSGTVFVPPSGSYTYEGTGGGSWPYTYPASQRYNETTEEWDDMPDATLTMETDTLGSHFTDIWNHINSTNLGGYTPNGMLIGHGVDYINAFKAAHTDLWCMSHNIILITDGEPNGPRETCPPLGSSDFNWDAGAKDMVREAYMAWHDDSVKVFAVGFGTSIDEVGRRTLNWTARWGGTCANPSAVSGNPDTVDPSGGCPSVNPRNASLSGYAYIADDANALAGALQEIFEEIVGQGEKAFSSAEVTSIEEEFISTKYEARLYLATFYPGEGAFWDGHLRALRLVEGGISLVNIDTSLVIWDAGALLKNRNPNTRDIYGIKSGSLLDFNSSNFDSADLDVPTANVNGIVNLVKGGSIVASDSAYLGDIFHSVPLRVGSPSYFFHDDDFDEYRDSISAIRPTVIYTGSNTGIIHAFADSSGEEIFGVIPENFTDEVKSLADSHRFFVDADPMAADVWFPSSVTDSFKNFDEWRTLLFAAQGEGGRGMTCLDVTNPDYPSHLFSLEEDTFGLTTSVPIIYKIERQIGTDTLERFFAFFGGGEWPEELYDIYNPDSFVKGNVIVALDVYDIAESGLTYGSNFWYIPSSSGNMDYPFASAGNMINLNPKVDNLYDIFYIPDLAGQLWKVDLRDPDVSSWSAQCIFQPPIPDSAAEDSLWQPVFFRPLIERDPVYGCIWLFFGTGDRSKIFKEGISNRFYAIMDTLPDSLDSYPLTESELKKVSPSGSFDARLGHDFPGYKGWYIVYRDYGHTDEKTVSSPILLLDTLKFATFDPEVSVSDCSVGGGYAREYSLHFRTGGAGSGGPSVITGSGIPQAPRYSFNMEGGGFEIHQTSDSVWVEKKSGIGVLKRVLRWLEK